MNEDRSFGTPDAIVVGSGAGGGTAAHVLTARGWKVVVLEKGEEMRPDEFLPFDELHFREHKALIPRVDQDPMVYIDNRGERSNSERWWEVSKLGGSTMIWDANFPRYTEEDFAVTRFMKDIPRSEHMVDWPWTYEEFLPYFERAEWDWCVSGDATQSPESMRPGYQYPMPPLKPHPSTAFLMDLFGKKGLVPYVGARAINSETFDARPPCAFCGYNQFFGCSVSSRSNSVNTVLARALDTGLCDVRTGHVVTRLEFDPGKTGGPGAIKGVWYKTEAGGEERFLSAPRVFVSIQTIQSARLFLHSEIPNSNGLIGRFLTYHAKGNMDFTFPGKPVWDMGPKFQPRTAIGSLQLRGLYKYRDDNGDWRKGGKFSVYDPYTCTTPIRLIKGASMGPAKPAAWGRDLVDYLSELRSQGGVSFSFTGDAMSLYDNRVELDKDVPEKGYKRRTDPWGVPVAATFYQHDPWDVATSKHALDVVKDVVANAGGELRKYEPQGTANSGYGHVHGALRAGKDPGSSVLNMNCESHAVRGLYVLDASFMPTAGASNPSLTLIANAYRVCSTVAKA